MRLQKTKAGTMQSSVLDTLLRLIETASGTNRLRDAKAREREEEEGKKDEAKK